MSSSALLSSLDPILLAGPTASGKSAVALLLAERLGGEIISVDSMQVYRGLDLGTAKPSATDRVRIPHHLVDVVNLAESFDAARFVACAGAALDGIRQRGRVAIFCGGTGLYFKAWLDGLGKAPPSDPAVRASLEATPPEELLRELSVGDPETFARIDRENPRRVIRALEVIRLTGRPFSSQRADWPASSTRPPARFFGLARDPVDLRRRIDWRVDQMFRDGLVEETRALLTHGLEGNATAMQSIGYRQVVDHLRGGPSLAATIELVKIRTRQLAKRQMTWFRRQMSPEWFTLEPEETAAMVTDRLQAALLRPVA